MESLEDFLTVVYPNLDKYEEKNLTNLKELVNVAIKSLENQNLIVNFDFILDEVLFIINEMEKVYYVNMILNILSILKNINKYDLANLKTGKNKIIINDYIYNIDRNPRKINVNFNNIKFDFTISTIYFNLFRYNGDVVLNPFQNYLKSKEQIYVNPTNIISEKLINSYGLSLNYEKDYNISVHILNTEKFEKWENSDFKTSDILPELYPIKYNRRITENPEENFNILSLREPLNREIIYSSE